MIQALRSDALTEPHGFLTRIGGVSTGPFASLNCSLSGQDSRDAVLTNRARAVEAIGMAPDRLVGVTQVHGDVVVHVTKAWPPGTGPKADAMVTDRPGLVLGIVTADCAPVLFADSDRGIVGAAHAGWRGAVGGVLEATLAAMLRLGSPPDRITASIGPCIGQASYEVAADLRDTIISRDSTDARFFADGARADRWQFDLRGYCRKRLLAAGVARVDDVDADTCADSGRFFSHRRRTLTGGGPIGHQISLIGIA